MTLAKGTKVQITINYNDIKLGAKGKVLAVRAIKETDLDFIALKKLGFTMPLGETAMVRFRGHDQILPINVLQPTLG